MSQTQVGDVMGVTKATVSQMERQGRVWPGTALRYVRAIYGPDVTMQIDVRVGSNVMMSEIVE